MTFYKIISLCVSPSQGPCCNSETCQFVGAARNQTCREASECSHASYCSGRAADCPTPQAMPNHTKCNNGTYLSLSIYLSIYLVSMSLSLYSNFRQYDIKNK